MQRGDPLPSLTKPIGQETLRKYAHASGDFNPLHLDPAYAATTQFGGTIAHGMLLMGYLSEVMTLAFGYDWAATGRLRARFRHPARPGDAVTIGGKVTEVVTETEGARVRCTVECRIQDGTVVASGDASLVIPSKQG
ncbi:MAG: MaoC family dehydratase N-terminal domain-containing protein [Chloroflexi bacterium]|nr:MaoC family dehydratase N-terminal domain-containing protein [Chloroflexota bacterium]